MKLYILLLCIAPAFSFSGTVLSYCEGYSDIAQFIESFFQWHTEPNVRMVLFVDDGFAQPAHPAVTLVPLPNGTTRYAAFKEWALSEPISFEEQLYYVLESRDAHFEGNVFAPLATSQPGVHFFAEASPFNESIQECQVFGSEISSSHMYFEGSVGIMGRGFLLTFFDMMLQGADAGCSEYSAVNMLANNKPLDLAVTCHDYDKDSWIAHGLHWTNDHYVELESIPYHMRPQYRYLHQCQTGWAQPSA